MVEKFVAKIPGTEPGEKKHAELLLNKKGQIVYRVRNKEIGEFDSLIFTDKELYFVEMTLTGSVADLRKRLPKKRALLQLLFPRYDVKPLLVVSEEAVGLNALPEYCSVWQSKGVDTTELFHWIADGKPRKPRKYQPVIHKKIVKPSALEVRTFRYYDTLVWIYHSLQGKKPDPINLTFYRSAKFVRFHDLFTKVYVGKISAEEFRKRYPDAPLYEPELYIAIEKDPLGGTFITYFHYHGRKSLTNVRIKGNGLSAVKKDPMGMTVTELAFLSKVLRNEKLWSVERLRALEKTLEEENREEGK